MFYGVDLAMAANDSAKQTMLRGSTKSGSALSTPGPTGLNDGGDPGLELCFLPQTPGSVGLNDGAGMCLERPRVIGFTVIPPKASEWFVHITRFNGDPVILEYDPRHGGKREEKLSYPVGHKSNFYRVGDIVLTAKHEEKWLYRIFPELGEPTPEHKSVLEQFAWGFLMGPPDQYTIGYKIKSIRPYSTDGKGSVVLQGVLFLDSKTKIEMEKTLEFPVFENFNMHWAMNRSAASMRAAEPVANFLYEVSMAVVSGGVSSATKGAARGLVALTLKQAMKRTARKALVRKVWKTMSGKLLENTLKATKAFCKTYIKEIRKGTSLADLAKRARPSDATFEREVAFPAVAKASAAFASTLVSASLGGAMSKEMTKSGLEGIQKQIAERVIGSFAVGLPDIFILGIGQAVAASANDPSKFDQELGKAMLAVIKGKFMNLVKLDISKLGAAMLKR